MTTECQQLAVCRRLLQLIEIIPSQETLSPPLMVWKQKDRYGDYQEINWSTEGLQVCHEAEKLLSTKEATLYYDRYLSSHHATYEQRLEGLCRVWFPEKFKL